MMKQIFLNESSTIFQVLTPGHQVMDTIKAEKGLETTS